MKNNLLYKLLSVLLAVLLTAVCLAPAALAEDESTQPPVSVDESSEPVSEEPSEPISEEPSEPVSEEPSDAPQGDTLTVTVKNPLVGSYYLGGSINDFPVSDGHSYIFEGKSAKITIKYIPKANEYLNGVYVGSSFFPTDDGTIVILTVTDGDTIVFDVAGYDTVKGEVVFEGADVGEAALLCDGKPVSFAKYVKGVPLEVTASLPRGCNAEKAVITFADGSEPVTLPFVDGVCALPAISSDFTITVTVSGDAMYSVTTRYEGEGSLSADGQLVKRGTSVVFTAIPAEGYYVKSAELNGTPVTVTDGKYTAVAYVDLLFTVVFAPVPESQPITLSVDPHASGGKIEFAKYFGSFANVPFGEEVEILFTPNEGYVLDRVYINGISTVPSENRITVKADAEYNIVAAFRKATYRITVVVTSVGGGSVEAVGYKLVNNMISVDHGGSVTFRVSPDLGHVVSSIKVDGQLLENDTREFTFSDITANHTVSVSFVAEGVDKNSYTVAVDCGDHGSVEPGTSIEVNEGDDLVISFIPDEGYEIDTVYFDGVLASLTQGKLVLVDIEADHIVQVKFKEKPVEQANYITISDINWMPDEVVIDLSERQRVAAEVFEKMASLAAEKRFVFSYGLFDVTLQAGALVSAGGEYVDLSYDTMIDPSCSEAFLAAITANGIDGTIYTVLEVAAAYPSASAMTMHLGLEFSAKTVNCYSFDGSSLAPVKIGAVADMSGTITVPMGDVRTFVMMIDNTAPENHIVTVNCGANGTADPINSQPVADGGDLTIRIFPFDGYVVDFVKVDGRELSLDEKARANGACELPLTNIRSNTTVDIAFVLMPTEANSSLGVGLVVVIISVALVGGGVLFFIQWKKTKY